MFRAVSMQGGAGSTLFDARPHVQACWASAPHLGSTQLRGGLPWFPVLLHVLAHCPCPPLSQLCWCFPSPVSVCGGGLKGSVLSHLPWASAPQLGPLSLKSPGLLPEIVLEFPLKCFIPQLHPPGLLQAS